MIIFLDTNIFFNNWHLKNANFKYLFNFASNTNSRILISEIVCSEIDNKVTQETYNLLDSLISSLEKYKKIVDGDLQVEIKPPTVPYNFKNIINKKTDKVIFYGYEDIENSILVYRAIKKIKPFQDQDKGFRDTLIWLSFLNYIKVNDIKDDIVFINNNSNDFYNKLSSDLHDDLREDLKIQGISNNLTVFKDLYKFVSSTIDKSKHGITIEEIYEDLIYNNERLIEIEIEDVISKISSGEALKIFARDNEAKKILSSLTSFKFKIIEGLEDIELLNYEVLDNRDLVFIELNFNLRLIEIEYVILTSTYKENYHLIEALFYNIEEVGDVTKIYDFIRIDFNISYTFNKESEEIQGLVINSSKILR